MAKLPQKWLDTEARNVVRGVAHRPDSEIAEILSQRQRRKVSVEDVAQYRREISQ